MTARVVTFDYVATKDTTYVMLDDMTVGAVWMTSLGACYDQINKQTPLSTDELAVVLNEMRLMERVLMERV